LTIKIKEFADYAEAEKALNQLKNLNFVTSGLINNAQGNAINLVISSDPKAVGEIQASLNATNIPIFSLSQSKPSLDDVFLSATGQTLQDAEIARSEIVPAKKRR
jgi:ABC-2 type transport system ATP-binding protein